MLRSSTRVRKPVIKPGFHPGTVDEIKVAGKTRRKPKNKNLEMMNNEEKKVHQRKRKASTASGSKKNEKKVKIQEPAEEEPERNVEFRFIGYPIPMEEARNRWPERYIPELIEKKRQEMLDIQKSKKDYTKCDDEPEEILEVKCHYSEAFVDGTSYKLYDDAHVMSGDKNLPHICKIIELFETVDNGLYFRAQWFYRPSDTVIREAIIEEDEEEKVKGKVECEEETEEDGEETEQGIEENDGNDEDDEDIPKEDYSVHLHEKLIFISDVKDNNPLNLLLGKISIARIPSNVAEIDSSDYHYKLRYELPYKSFVSISTENTARETSIESSRPSTESDSKDAVGEAKVTKATSTNIAQSSKSELSLLDLYSGCGAMSTGLTVGAEVGGLKLVTRWAVDINVHACDTFTLNHPDTNVRNERAQDFLSLLIEWERLCEKYLFKDPPNELEDLEELPEEDIVGISYGHPKINAENLEKKNKKKIKATELYFRVRLRGHGPDDDRWEPKSGLRNAEFKIYEFVKVGHQSKVLPLPRDVDVICGGPPCQGISGFNRFRNSKSPLDDNRNYQMLVYMNIVKFLKPDYILMENVVDLVKFVDGYMGRYAVRRLLSMDFQVRMGIMAAGSFGLPQFRMRVFVWGAKIGKKLPPYPYPTHDVVAPRGGGVKAEFEQCIVAYNAINKGELKEKLFLGDALSDLPEVQNNEDRDEIPYVLPHQSEFQNFIRRDKLGLGQNKTLYDHQPLVLNEDDYERVCRIPREKGACFCNLDGVIQDDEKKWTIDPSKRVLLPSGKPLVPDYTLTFCGGKSKKPFGRLWWDEIVPTVVTRAEPHNQVITHPVQDRVLTVRENARLQGFPDWYRLRGPVKEKYIQVGNAVAIPVAKALGYTLARTLQGFFNDEPLYKLPDGFSFAIGPLPTPSVGTNN